MKEKRSEQCSERFYVRDSEFENPKLTLPGLPGPGQPGDHQGS